MENLVEAWFRVSPMAALTDALVRNYTRGKLVAKPQKLAHFVLRTSNYEEMVDWYKKVLNANVTFGNETLSFLTYDDEHHRVAFLNMPGLSDLPEGASGVDHVAFTYSSLSELLSHYKKLKEEEGIEPFWCINHGPTTSLYYRDPDGNQIELQVENFDSLEESTEFFYSEAFSENPIGVDFDPEDLHKRLSAGESEENLKIRPSSGPRGLDDGVPLGKKND